MGGMREDDVVGRLADVPPFEGVSKKGLRQIAAMAKERTYGVGAELTVEATRGARFHLILEGEVAVKAGRRTLAVLGAGDTVGEMALLDEQPRAATVSVTQPTTTLSLASWNFRRPIRWANSIRRF